MRIPLAKTVATSKSWTQVTPAVGTSETGFSDRLNQWKGEEQHAVLVDGLLCEHCPSWRAVFFLFSGLWPWGNFRGRWRLCLKWLLDRRVNIDPGYVDGARLVLAFQRTTIVFILDGIFAEVDAVGRFERGKFYFFIIPSYLKSANTIIFWIKSD